jgi:hypothetical protein
VTQPESTTGEQRPARPVTPFDPVRDRPVCQLRVYLNALLAAFPIHWNECGARWVLTSAAVGGEVFQNAAVFNEPSIAPGSPNPNRWNMRSLSVAWRAP